MNIQIFDFRGSDIREITDKDGNPWFVAKDVCIMFGDKNHNRSVQRVESEDKRHFEILDSMGRPQKAVFVNESGLYALLFQMQPQKANNNGVQDAYPIEIKQRIEKLKAFKKWVTSEVLPSIRKRGGYLSPAIDFTDPDNIQRILDGWKEDRRKLEIAQPKAEFADAVVRDKYTHYSITEASKHFNMTRNEMFDLLRRNHLLLQDNTPSQKALREEVLTYRLNPGINGTNRPQSVFTSENLFNFHKIYLSHFGQLDLIPFPGHSAHIGGAI